MKKILLFGAGKSATVLINYLLEEAAINNWVILIADSNSKLIEEKTRGNRLSRSIELDITDSDKRRKLIEEADIVISMMPPALHILIAKDCITCAKNLLTASYADDEIRALQASVQEKGLLFLCEMGLDPGIDHMSAMQLLDDIKAGGGKVFSFKSHCGGLVAPESDNNPWHYKISWNPRNIVLAGKAGAIYRQDGKTVEEKYEALFDAGRKITVKNEETDTFSYYPNRNSLPYIDLYGLQEADTFIRTTLRYPDFMYGWKNIIDLKLTDETPAYDTDGKSLESFFKEHFEKHGFSTWLEQSLSDRFSQTRQMLENLMKQMREEELAREAGEAVPEHLLVANTSGDLEKINTGTMKSNHASGIAANLHEANLTLKQLFFLGLDDHETLINKGFASAADVLQLALEKKLALQPGDKDMIVMLHEIDYTLNGKSHHIKSSLIVKGDNHLHTAMAKTVGLPLGIAAKLILNGTIKLSGIHIPVNKLIYEPVLTELSKHGIAFREIRD